MGSDTYVNDFTSSIWAHKVSFTYDFDMDSTLVTQSQYQTVMDTNPSGIWLGDRKQDPVENVTWYDAVQYCMKVTAQHGLDQCYDTTTYHSHGLWVCDITKNGFRLPTEAEYEYGCRGGSTGFFFWGNDTSKIGDYCWWVENANGTTHPVALKKANGVGLYDICGNVSEWCDDFYDTYPKTDQVDPDHVLQDGNKSVRGGSCADGLCPIVRRYFEYPTNSNSIIGFRTVCTVSITSTNRKVSDVSVKVNDFRVDVMVEKIGAGLRFISLFSAFTHCLNIIAVDGHIVRRLNPNLNQNSIDWDCLDDNRKRVNSGVYILLVRNEKNQFAKQFIVTK
jgi:hypothetical protein